MAKASKASKYLLGSNTAMKMKYALSDSGAALADIRSARYGMESTRTTVYEWMKGYTNRKTLDRVTKLVSEALSKLEKAEDLLERASEELVEQHNANLGTLELLIELKEQQKQNPPTKL